jgi:hypothetical protein
MNKENINLANNIFHLSQKFDNLIDDTTNDNIDKMNDILYQIQNSVNKITSLKLKNICQEIFNLHSKELQLIQKNTKVTSQPKKKNILFLFVDPKCSKSINFLNTDWDILKKYNNTKNKINMVIVACDGTAYYKETCERFNIIEYPSIRYIAYEPKPKIYEYYGDLNANSIQEQYKF